MLSMQADMGQTFSLSLDFLGNKGPIYLKIQSIVWQTAGMFGFYYKQNDVHRSDWKRKPIEWISGMRTIQNGGWGIIEYLPYIYHP